MDDVIPHPFASILFALVVGALFLWHGFEENQPPKRLAHVRPFILTEKQQATRLAQQIQPVPRRAEPISQRRPHGPFNAQDGQPGRAIIFPDATASVMNDAPHQASVELPSVR